MKKIIKYYWDACAWIALIQREQTRIDSLEFVIEQARDKNSGVQIWTSTFTLAEVYKRPCDGDKKGLQEGEDQKFEDYLEQDFVQKIEVTSDVGTLARRLLRQHCPLGKPQDAIHLASALLYNLDELHTFDREDLIGLSQKIQKRDGTLLTIGNPPKRPPPPEPPPPPPAPPLIAFLEATNAKQNETTAPPAEVSDAPVVEAATDALPNSKNAIDNPEEASSSNAAVAPNSAIAEKDATLSTQDAMAKADESKDQ